MEFSQQYNPLTGISYWGKFQKKFPEIEYLLRDEFYLVRSITSGNNFCLIKEEQGRELWQVNFVPSTSRRGKDTLSFEYWNDRITLDCLEKDPMKTAAEKVYYIIKREVKKITLSNIDIPLNLPWIEQPLSRKIKIDKK